MREAAVSLSEDELEAIGLGDLVAAFRTAGLRELEEFACYGDGAVVQVEVDEAVDEEEVDGFDTVDRWERLTDAAPHRYLVAFTAPELGGDVAESVDELVGTCDPRLEEDDVKMSLVGDTDTIRDTVGAYREAGLTPELQRMANYEGENPTLDDLTDRQLEVVETAYKMGYYDIPREASTEDVAEALDLDDSTVAEHLQRAERNVLAHHLEE